MNATEKWILEQVLEYIVNAKQGYLEARIKKDTNESINLTVKANHQIDTAVEGIRSILDPEIQ